VPVRGGSVSLPFLRTARTANLTGTVSPRLESFLKAAPFPVAADVLAGATEPALVPPAQRRARHRSR
jgi:hypothetical protein